MFQCLLCMLSSLLMLLPSLISFLVRSLYNSYLLLVFRQCFVLLSHFCFLRSRPPREIFSFPILSLSRFPLRQADTAFHFPFLALYFALFIISICFPVYQLSTAICVLVFLLLPASYFFPPSLLETNGISFLFNYNYSPFKKKKPKSLKDCDHCKQIGTMGSSTHCSECVR